MNFYERKEKVYYLYPYAFMSWSLDILSIELTNRCNLNCCYCVNKAINYCELELDVIINLVESCLSFGFEKVILTGGEPLLRKDFHEILKCLSKYDVNIDLLTNGLLLQKQTVFSIRNYVDVVQISVDGCEEVHDMLCGVKGAFRKAVSAIKLLRDADVKVRLSATLTNDNKDSIMAVLDIAKELNVDSVTMRRATGISNNVDKETYRELLSSWIKKAKYYGLNCYPRDPLTIFVDKDLFKKAISYEIGGCGAGIASISVGAEGNIYPCHGLPIKLGNVKKNANVITEVWENSEILEKFRRRDLKGKCKTCKYRFICGGCRAEAYWQRGDMFASDPMCWL